MSDRVKFVQLVPAPTTWAGGSTWTSIYALDDKGRTWWLVPHPTEAGKMAWQRIEQPEEPACP